MKSNNEGSALTVSKLKKYKFVKEVLLDRDDDEFTCWIRNGITIYEERYGSKPQFLYGTYIKGDGSFKSGFVICTDAQLENLYYSLTNTILDEN